MAFTSQEVTLTAMKHPISHSHNVIKPHYQWLHLQLPCPVFISIHIPHIYTNENCLDYKSTLQEVKMRSITFRILCYEYLFDLLKTNVMAFYCSLLC